MPPNILFIITDQHRAISTGCYGPTDARTPNIDRLAEESARFHRAYCQYPICGASRQSLLTGRYPGRNGTYQNLLRSIDPWQWTFPGALTRAGYETALIGKAHCNQNGFLYRLESEEYAHRYRPKDVLDAIQPPLFGLDYRRNAETAGPWPHDERYLQSNFVEREGIRFLQQEHRQPFFAYLSYDYPHPPFLVPERYWNAIDPEALTLPPPDPEHPVSAFWGEELVNEAMIRNYLRGYYACLACVDASIGRVLDAAETAG
jgi:Arylsulfatase A and related enzymes